MFTICKRYPFEMAHKLKSSYSKECQQIHGHSYKLEVTIQSDKLNEDGMVMDFKKLNEIMEPIIATYDHEYLDFDVCHYNPTAENMAKKIYYKICFGLIDLDSDPAIKLIKVRLWETEKAYVEYQT